MRASHRQAAPGAPDGVLVHYKRYRPEQTTLQHVATFFAQAESRVRRRLATVVKDEFDAFRECGLLAHGFPRLLRVQLQPRRLCPLCGPRRMSQTAAHLVNHGIPHVPVR